jgi:3-hydroxybutyryl-CoA dehydrogenase
MDTLRHDTGVSSDKIDSSAMPASRRVCILGESPLVEEYASLCLNKGYVVQVVVAQGGAGTSAKNKSHGKEKAPSLKLPTGVKKIAKPPKSADVALELTNTSVDIKKKNLIALDKMLGPDTPIISSSVTVCAGTQAGWLSYPGRLIGLGALPSLLDGSLMELAPSPATNAATLAAANTFAGTLGKETAMVRDAVGLVMPRIVCMLANEACFAIMDDVATGRDIDTAMKLGTNYPRGPVEWAERIGIRHVNAVITALYKNLRDERYRVAPLLQQTASTNGRLMQA